MKKRHICIYGIVNTTVKFGNISVIKFHNPHNNISCPKVLNIIIQSDLSVQSDVQICVVKVQIKKWISEIKFYFISHKSMVFKNCVPIFCFNSQSIMPDKFLSKTFFVTYSYNFCF